MNKLKFNALLRRVTTRCRLDPEKAKTLTNEERRDVTYHVVRNRNPVATCLLPDDADDAWLNAMGYLYESRSKTSGLVFRHTSEHCIR